MVTDRAESVTQKMVEQRAIQIECDKELRSISLLKAQLDSDADELTKTTD